MRTITKGLLKRLQQLVTSLGPTLLAVLRGVGDSVQAVQTLLAETPAMSGYVFNNHETKEMLGIVGSKDRSISNLAQQYPTTDNNSQQRPTAKLFKRTQYVWLNNVASVCTGL